MTPRKFFTIHDTYQCRLACHKYTNDRLALQITFEDEHGVGPFARVSSNLPASPDPGPDCYYAKTYSENVGLNERLAELGLVEYVRLHENGYPIYRLLPAAKEYMQS